MKRSRTTTLLVALLTILAIVAAACGSGGEEADAGGLGTLSEGKLTVGSDIPFPPFEFEENGELTGFDVELIEEIADRLGLETEWVATPFDTIFTQLAAGQFDVVASATTRTLGREYTVNFSIPYYLAQQALSINEELTPEIQSVDDLEPGMVVAVQSGTTGEDWANANLAPRGVEVRAFPSAPDTYTALEAGTVTAVIFDEPSAVEEAKNRPALAVVDVIDTGEQYGFGVNPANGDLLAAINNAMRDMVRDGTYDTIYERWFPGAEGGSVSKNQ